MTLLQEMAAPRRPGEHIAVYQARLKALADIASDLAEECSTEPEFASV